jgi:spermidine/putrescine transport system permease protein
MWGRRPGKSWGLGLQERTRFNIVANTPTALIAVSGPLLAIGLLLALSVHPNDGHLFEPAFTFGNYVQAFHQKLFWMVLVRSVVIAGIVTLATVCLAYPVAYSIAFHGGARKNALLILVTLPFWTSYLLRIFAWKIILGYNGVLNSAMVGLGIPGAPFEALLYTRGAMTLTLAHAYAAFAILPLYVSISAIDPKLLEAARDLGAEARVIFRKIILPLSFPGVLAASILVFIPTLGDYATPTLVGGPTSTMIGNVIQAQFGKANNWPYGSAIAILTMLIIVVLALAVVGLRRARFTAQGQPS